MHSMSTKQTLDVWHELELALQGKNGFGGDTAEIYAYRLTPSNPSLEGNGIYNALENPRSYSHEEAIEYVNQTRRDLCDLCRYFEKTTESSVQMVLSRFPLNTISLDAWEASGNDMLFVHRVHLQVTPPPKASESPRR